MSEAPDLDEGYFKIANKMLPVLMDVPIRREAKFVLLDVIAQCWGRSKAEEAMLNIKRICTQWNLRNANVWRGLHQLKEAGVLVECGDELTVRFDKRALVKLLPQDTIEGLESYGEAASKRSQNRIPQESKVNPPGVKRIPQESVTTENRIPQESKVNPPGVKRIPQESVTTENRIPQESKPNPPGVKTESPRSQNRIPQESISAPPRTPLRKKTEDLKTEDTQSVCVRASDEVHPSESDKTPIEIIASGPSRPDPVVLQKVQDKLEAMQPMREWPNHARSFAATYPLHWVEKACELAIVRGKRSDFAHGVLRRWVEDGGPADMAAGNGSVRADSAVPARVPYNPHEARMAQQRAIVDRRKAEREKESQNESL